MLALFFVIVFIVILTYSAYQEWKVKQQRDTIDKAKYKGDSLKEKTQNVVRYDRSNRNSVGK